MAQKTFCTQHLMDINFLDLNFLDQNSLSPISFGFKILQIQKHFGPHFFLVRVEVEWKLKWITSKTYMTNSRPLKTALRLFQSCWLDMMDEGWMDPCRF